MSQSDPIGDMLTQLRNANRAKHSEVQVKRSNLTVAILQALKKDSFVYDFKTIEDDKQGMVRVYLKPPSGLDRRRIRTMTDIQRVSRPGLRIYAQRHNIPRVLNGLGLCILSTSKGVMSGDEARRSRVGGEVLLKVW